MDHSDPRVDHSLDPRVDQSDPRVDQDDPRVDQGDPRGDSGTDDPRFFLQCILYSIIKFIINFMNF